MTSNLKFLIEPEQLQSLLERKDLMIVDVGDTDAYQLERIPGAVHVDYLNLVSGQPPASGQLPSVEVLQDTLSTIGLTGEQHVVAYDAEGNGRASRLLWTLDVLGHSGSSLLNGGFTAWKNEGYPIERSAPRPIERSNYIVHLNGRSQADKNYVLMNLGESDVGFLDARSPMEFQGFDVRSLRGGHIPGARNVNWLDTIDRARNNRFKSNEELLQMLAEQGLTPDKEIITYCQTHHRSSHSYAMLKSLGFDRIRGYAGSWSEWGNSQDTPIEC